MLILVPLSELASFPSANPLRIFGVYGERILQRKIISSISISWGSLSIPDDLVCRRPRVNSGRYTGRGNGRVGVEEGICVLGCGAWRRHRFYMGYLLENLSAW